MKRFLLAFVIVSAALALSPRVHAQVTVQLAPVPRQIFFSASGSALSLGCVYTWSAGTSTFLATYTDSTGTTQNPDPLQLGLDGGASIWFTGAAYKVGVYQNSSGGACPGTPGGSLALVYTADNITTAVSSGGATASQLTSSAANPASTGIIRLAKSDQACFRNNANSANICLSIDANNNLSWTGGSLALSEIAAPSGVGGEDLLWADSAAHRLKQSGNGGSAAQLVNAGVDINTSDQVTSTHLASPLPAAQGGTGVTSVSGTGNPCYTTSCALTTPTIGGTTITNVPFMAWGGYVANNLNAANAALTQLRTRSAIIIDDWALDIQTGLTGCSPYPTFALYDETAASSLNTITLTSGTLTYENSSLSLNVAANHVLDVRQTTQGSGCTGNGGAGNATVRFYMQ